VPFPIKLFVVALFVVTAGLVYTLWTGKFYIRTWHEPWFHITVITRQKQPKLYWFLVILNLLFLLYFSEFLLGWISALFL
jgi:hypothetical protein